MSTNIAEDFKHGSNFKHGHNVVIEPDVIVGDDVKLGNNVVLKSGTRFGSVIDFSDYCCTTGACILGNHINSPVGVIHTSLPHSQAGGFSINQSVTPNPKFLIF